MRRFRHPPFFCAVLLPICVLILGITARCQTAVVLAPLPQLQYFDQSGRPLSFGCVFTFISGTTTPLSTYTDSTGSTLNANPVVLSGGGSANIWLQAGALYTMRLKASGGTNCASGTQQYTINGIGGGASQTVTPVPYSPTPQFIDTAQNQLFTMTLTGDAVSLPLSAATVQPPGLVTWQITQDGVGGHLFTWPANVIGGATIGSSAGQVTTQMFIWNGTNATAIGPATTGPGPAEAIGSFALGASQYLSAVQGAGNKIATAASGSFANGHLIAANSTNDLVDSGFSIPGGPATYSTIANASVTGTTANKLVKLTGTPSTAVLGGTGDVGGEIGICLSGCGTTGSALVQQSGVAQCTFDAATTAGDLVGISSMTSGDCTDLGVAPPYALNSAQVIGQVMATVGSSGLVPVLMTPIYNQSITKTFHITGVTLGVAGHQFAATWSGGAFADTNYTANCTLWSAVTAIPGPLHRDFVLGFDSKTAAAVNVWLTTLDSVTDTVNVDCSATHD